MKKSLVVFFTIILFTSAISAQDCAEFNRLVSETYNFKPSKLTAAQRDVKSAAMDVVWEKVKANQKDLLRCLREALNAPSSDAFFKFDGSNLLIMYDQSAEAKKTLIKSYAEVDFADIAPEYWMPYIAALGYEGFDTSAAGQNWLRAAKPEYTLPQHANLQVTKEIGALVIFGTMDESIATPALAKLASNVNDPIRETAVWILMQQATPESIVELKKLSGLSPSTRLKVTEFLTKPKLVTPREGTPKITREQYVAAFKELTEGRPLAFGKIAIEVPDGERDAVAVLKPEDIPLIRKARRAITVSATPHSGEWYEGFTSILLTMVLQPQPEKVAVTK